MKIIVTGGAGFIGSHVVDLLIENGHEVVVVDDLSTGKKQNLNPKAKFIQADIRETAEVKAIFLDEKPEVVYHLAAQASVSYSMREPVKDAEINILGTINILEACQSAGVGKIVYTASGGSMYGNSTELPYKETLIGQPVSHYGMSKHASELYVWEYTRICGLKATVLRYANVYGPRQDPHGEAGVCAIFTPKMLNGEDVTIFGDGSQTRDYIFVGDVARANLLALDKGSGEAFNIGTGVETSTLEVFQILKNAIQYKKDPVMAPERPGDALRSVLDIQKAKQLLGWYPAHDFSKGITKTVAWYQIAES